MVKKRLKYNFYFILFLIISNVSLFSQDPVFSHFYSNKLYLNPAFAGSSETAGLGINFRNEWFGKIKGLSFSTLSVSFDQFVNKFHGGFGIHILDDKQGSAYNKLEIDGIYSYALKVSDNAYFMAGLQASLFYKTVNPGELVFPSNINQYGDIIIGSQHPLADNTFYPDFSTGIIGNIKNSYFGISVHHLTQPKESFSFQNDKRLKRKYSVHFGTDIKIFKNGLIKEHFSISPNFLYQYQYQHQLNYGLYFTLNDIWLGAWFRQNLVINYDALVLMVGYSKPEYDLSYSYDFKFPKVDVGFLNIHVHEVTFLLKFQYNQKKKFKAIKCPKF